MRQLPTKSPRAANKETQGWRELLLRRKKRFARLRLPVHRHWTGKPGVIGNGIAPGGGCGMGDLGVFDKSDDRSDQAG